MGVPISVRGDFDAARLRGFAKKTKNGSQARRLLALAAIYDGATRTAAAKMGGVGVQIIRDWVLRFNARGPDGLLDGKAPGRPCKLDAGQRQAIARMIESGPIPAVHGVVRWRACDLIMRLHEEFGLSVSDDTVYRALKELGFSHVSARPKAYKQDADAMDAFKKTLPHAWPKSARTSRRAHR
jgi:putative transposase